MSHRMSHRLAAIGIAVIVFASGALGPAPAAAQVADSAAGDWTPPRTPEGRPDLEGVWSNAILTPLERPPALADKAFLTEEEAEAYLQEVLERNNRDRRDGGAEADVARAYNDFWWDRGTSLAATRRTSLIIDPPDGRIPPLTPEAEQRAAARAEYRRLHPADGPESRSLLERCINVNSAGPPMLPSAYNNNYQIFQTPDYVVILNEMIHDARIIPLDGRPPLPGAIRQWLGSSRGRWEGDTLVVETTNFTDQTNFRGASENMHLTERFTRVAEDILLYEFTVNDPAAFTRSWTAQIPSRKADGLIYEYNCHEGNEGLAGILAGARAEEEAAREAAAEAAR